MSSHVPTTIDIAREIQPAPAIWIPVGECLPPSGHEVLVTGGGLLWFARLDAKRRWWLDGRILAHDDMLTHWLPLPELPTLSASAPLREPS